MARQAAPSPATQALVRDLRADGVPCSARRLEDWARVGLVPRARRRSLGRGRGTEVIYPPDMVERCRLVGQRMRRGQPWQVVALGLFASGVELPEDAVRAAYQWAFAVGTPPHEDELDAAERGANQFVHTAAGARVARLIASHIKSSGLADGEPPQAVARSVLTNIFLIPLGGEPADDEAVIEVIAGLGLPIQELPPDVRAEAARMVGSVAGAFSFEELLSIVDCTSVSEMRSLLPAARAVLDVLPAEFSALMPETVADVLPALFVPILIRLRSLVEQLADPPRGPEGIGVTQGASL